VRIYIGGGRTLGTSSEGVVIHSLSGSYCSQHYLGARRRIRKEYSNTFCHDGCIKKAESDTNPEVLKEFKNLMAGVKILAD